MGSPLLVGHGLADVDDLLRLGRFAEAGKLISTRDDAPALIASARVALFFEGAYEKALAAVERVIASEPGADLAIYARALRANVRAHQGKQIERFDIVDLAGASRAVISELVYFIALAHYVAREFNEADRWLNLHEPAESDFKSRMLVLRGYIAAAQERFGEQARHCAAAVRVLMPNAEREPYLFANAVRAYAVIARDVPTGDLEISALLRLLPNDFSASRFHAMRAHAWRCSLNGAYHEGLKWIMRAASEARTDVERMFAHLDHASLALFHGEGHAGSARAAFAVAVEYAHSIDWEALDSDDLAALPLAAQVAADLDAAEIARSFYQRAFALRGGIAPRYALAHDGRYDAFVNEAIALSEANHDRARSVGAATDAYSYFARVGFEWRAARMAIVLHQIGREAVWRERAAEHLRPYPRNPFEAYVQAGRFKDRALTQRQREVYDLLLEGCDTTGIAGKLGIAPDTVRIHLGRIYAHFGVKNRISLLAKFRVSA